MLGGERGPELTRVSRERDRDRSDRAGLDDQHERPPVEESPERTVELRQIDVLPARAGHGGREPPVAERPRDRERTGERPDHEEPARGGQPARDVGRDDEDARSDHRPRDQRGGVEEPEAGLEAAVSAAQLASPAGGWETGAPCSSVGGGAPRASSSPPSPPAGTPGSSS